MKNSFRAAIAVLGVIAIGAAHAQAGRASGPAEPSAPDPEFKYQSAFEGYRRFEDPKLASWRAVNDEVGALRGHIDHIKDRSERAVAPGASSGASAPAHGPMHHHGRGQRGRSHDAKH